MKGMENPLKLRRLFKRTPKHDGLSPDDRKSTFHVLDLPLIRELFRQIRVRTKIEPSLTELDPVASIALENGLTRGIGHRITFLVNLVQLCFPGLLLLDVAVHDIGFGLPR